MKTFNLEDNEIDVVIHAVKLLEKDCNFDLITYSRSGNLDAVSQCVDVLSSIKFILNKIKF